MTSISRQGEEIPKDFPECIEVSSEHIRRERRAAEAAEREAAIEAELAMLLPALQPARYGRVIALAPFRRLKFVGLTPFHLHARWPDALHWLPLTITVAVIPFNPADLDAASLPLYRVGDVREARRAARWARLTKSRDCRDDFVHPDWEAGAHRLRGQLDHALLSPRAFVCIERVRSDGSTLRITRPSLGRHADRNAPRPRVLIPSARETSARAIETLAGSDLVVMDLQGLRGRRSLQTVQAVLEVRSAARPTVIVASSPSDLFAAKLDEPPAPDRLVLVGSPSPLEAAEVIIVAHDRLVADERFHATLSDLADQSTAAGRLVALAKNAWWAARQAVDPEGGVREWQRFERALEDLAREDALIAGFFTACRDLLNVAAADIELCAERRRATVEAVLQRGTPGAVLVLAPTWRAAAALRAAVAVELDLDDEEDLEELGVWIRTVHAAPLPTVPGMAVLAGYAGMATIDAVFASGARRVRAVFDPVEARVAWYNAQRMADYLDRAGAAGAATPLHRLADELSPHAIGFAPIRELLPDDAHTPTDSAPSAAWVVRPTSDEAVVGLTDGTLLQVPLGARFEVLGRGGLGSRVVAVTDLEPGDEIILLDEEARTLFSERRMTMLDMGVLKTQSEARASWLGIARAVAKAKNLKPLAIARAMRARGYSVTVAAVRRWFCECPEESHVPSGIDRFLALADVLGLELPQETLRSYYQEIHTWRVRHRRAGREVAQAIRLAYTGRLGPATLTRIERDWGVGVRALVDAAQVGVVDEVLLPEEARDARSKAE